MVLHCGQNLILPGVHIGKNSLIGAGTVVTKDVGDYELVRSVINYKITKLLKES